MNAPDEGELFVCGHGETPDARHWCQDMRDAGIPWPGSAVADADLAELRARAEKAEAEAAREFESGNDWCVRALAAEAEAERLRDGIQALADEWESLDPDRKWGDNWRGVQADAGRRLRGLLSPTPEGPTP